MQQSSQGTTSPDLAPLERKLAAQPASPLFARLAAGYIANNRPAQALKICLQGMRSYPDYPTGLLMIAKAQVMLRQYSDARETLHELLRLLPGCPAAMALMERMQELELEYPPYTAVGGSHFATTSVERDASGAAARRQWSRQDNILPDFEPPKHPAPETAGPEREDTPKEPAEVEYFDLVSLASRLESARIPALPEEETASVEEVSADGIDEVNLEVRPVTETLISIYVQQGKLREAIDAYRRLADRHQDRRAEFEEKIRDLETRIENK
jgi:tetratricopeptide (TPR) repeat protein